MSRTLGQTPSHTVSQTQTDTHVFWRGQWHRFAGAEDSPPPAPPETPPAPVTPTAGQTPPAKPFDDAYVRDLRKENATYRKQAEEAQARLKEIDDAQKSELQKATERAEAAERRADEAQTAHRDALIRSAVLVQAGQLGYADPEDAYPLLLARGERVETNEQGEPTNVKKLLEDLLKAKPHLAKAGTPGTTAVPGTPRQNGVAPTREQLINDKTEKLKASGSYSRL